MNNINLLDLIIPVIDIKDEVAVGAFRGERDEYGPLESVICESPDPVEVAKAYQRIGFKEIYIADLDGIMKDMPNLELLKRISWETKLSILVDIGIWSRDDALKLDEVTPVIASETFSSLNMLRIPGRFVLSLDTRNGELISAMDLDLDRFIDIVIKGSQRIKEIIVLDLARAGTCEGPNLELCREIKKKIPDKRIYYGGGIRGIQDIKILLEIGISKVLVGRAIHFGMIFR